MKKLPISFLFIIFFSCSNEISKTEDIELKLPLISETGANTFGCLVNDFIIIPREAVKLNYNQNGIPSGKGISMEGDYYNSGNTFSWRQFRAENNKSRNNFYAIEFKLPNFPTMAVGTYDWGNSVYDNEIVVSVYYLNNQTNEHQFYTSDDLSGKFIVTKKDNTTNIFSGNFTGRIKNQDGTKEIQIKEGRFDMNLLTINNHFFP